MLRSKRRLLVGYLLCFATILLLICLKTLYRLDDQSRIEVFPQGKYRNWTLTKENETCRNTLRKIARQLDEPAYEITEDPMVIPASARVRAKKIFKNKSLVMWSSELHMTPIKCVIDLIEPFGVNVLNYNLDPARCHMQNCKAREKLKVLNGKNILLAEPPLDKRFYEAYKDDEIMKSVDVVFCGHPASICEFFLPLNKSVVIIASVRYDIGRYTAERWLLLNENLKKFASKPWNVIGANNLYDAKYIEYYTGLRTHHVPSFCDYTGAEYTNENSEFLIFRRYDRGFNKVFFGEFEAHCKRVNCTSKIKLLPPYTYKQLAQYKAVVHVPYQVSIMTFFELYRMNIPTFFPSQSLLAKWQVDHFLMPERSVDGHFYNQRIGGSIIPPHPNQKGIPDPRDEYTYDGIFYWLQFVDFYQDMPYTIIYDNIPHLISMLDNVEDKFLWNISRKMQAYNVEFKKDLLSKWRDMLLGFASNSPNGPK